MHEKRCILCTFFVEIRISFFCINSLTRLANIWQCNANILGAEKKSNHSLCNESAFCAISQYFRFVFLDSKNFLTVHIALFRFGASGWLRFTLPFNMEFIVCIRSSLACEIGKSLFTAISFATYFSPSWINIASFFVFWTDIFPQMGLTWLGVSFHLDAKKIGTIHFVQTAFRMTTLKAKVSIFFIL